jgi:hypothetical protein
LAWLDVGQGPWPWQRRLEEIWGIKPLAFGQFGEMLGPGLEALLAGVAKRGADEMADRYLIENRGAAVGRVQVSLADLGPVLSPLVSAQVFWDPKIFSLGRQNRPAPLWSSRHVLIERKGKSNAGGLHLLLIIKWPGATPAILLLQLLLN